jgi:hypothetical protein
LTGHAMFLASLAGFVTRRRLHVAAHCGALTICILWATVDAGSSYRVFLDWLDSVSDVVTRARIQFRIDRLAHATPALVDDFRAGSRS